MKMTPEKRQQMLVARAITEEKKEEKYVKGLIEDAKNVGGALEGYSDWKGTLEVAVKYFPQSDKAIRLIERAIDNAITYAYRDGKTVKKYRRKFT